MAYDTKRDPRGFIDFRNLAVDYADGDVEVFERVTDLAPIYPLKPTDNIILLCIQGQLSLSLDEKSFDVQRGDLVICPSRIKVSDADHSGKFECGIIRITDHLVQSLLRDKTTIWNHSVSTDLMSVLKLSDRSLEEFIIYYSLIGYKTSNIREGAPYEILLALLRAFLLDISFMLEAEHGYEKVRKLSQGKVLFNRFLSLISTSAVKRRPISEYASMLAITPKYLTMLCQKYSDKTASEWVVQYTTEEIRFYLKSSDLSIKEVSAKLGFSNMSHFGSYVRKHLGMSPSEFRYSKN